MNKQCSVEYAKVIPPSADCSNVPVMLSDETMQERYQKILHKMQAESIDTLAIYADLEHGNNFEYITGFLPRFEEAMLILHASGENYMLLGNENLNKASHARISVTPIHVPYFSLPNQPMENTKCFVDLFKDAQLGKSKRIGVVGWKNFTSRFEDNTQLFDIPYYIVEAIKKAAMHSELYNATSIFIGNGGVRCCNNANEIEHYEFGASLASDCMLKTMDYVNIGVSEMELGTMLQAYGQKHSVVTIAAVGKRFEKANLYPTNKTISQGDIISLTIGYKGGLSSRVGYGASSLDDIKQADYLDVVVKPYYQAIVTWLSTIHCGIKGSTVYDAINTVLPKEVYHWSLCPGHLTSDEEWLSSPIYEHSDEVLQSGMMFQTDIIPSIAGYDGTSAESTIALADKALRKDIQEKCPMLWKRIVKRREYLEKELHIVLHEDVLPMCSTLAYLRPLLLNDNMAMRNI